MNKYLREAEDDDDELLDILILWKIYKYQSLNYPIEEKFCYESIPNYQFYKLFRFQREDFEYLYTKLKFPTFITNQNRTTAGGRDVLLMVLRRLSYPVRLNDLKQMFHRSISSISMFIQKGIIIIILRNSYNI